MWRNRQQDKVQPPEVIQEVQPSTDTVARTVTERRRRLRITPFKAGTATEAQE